MTLRLKRHIGLPLLLMGLAAALILGTGDQRIYAYSVQGSGPVVEQVAIISADAATHLAAAAGSIQWVH